jgi:glycine/D-amino acid oxidase-like deaminating enzyme
VTRTRYGVSPWVEEVPARRRPQLPVCRGDVTVPVAIIGGGLTGVLTAYAFSAAGIRVALFEADRLGLIGAARSTGVIAGEATASFHELAQRHGRRVARAMFDATRRAVLEYSATARRLGLRDVTPRDAWRVLASFDGNEKQLLKDATARRDAGLVAVVANAAVARRETGVESARAAVRLRDWAEVQPFRALSAFAAAALARGAMMYERTAVRRVKTGRRSVSLHLESAVVTADTVIVCTGEPTDLFRPLRRHFTFADRYAVVTEPLPAPLRRRLTRPEAILLDTDAPPHTIRWMADGRVLVAGGDQPRTPARARDKVVVQRTGQLMYELSRLYPDVSGIMPAYGWDLPLACSADGVMIAGPHRNYPRHLFGWATGHDPAHAFLASRILLRHYLGQATREDEYFALARGGLVPR